MFKKLFHRLKKIEEQEEKQEEILPKEIEIEITLVDKFTKVDIKDDCTVIEYVETMKKNSQEWIEDKIPNATLFDKSTNINKKIIYLFERGNTRYSCYTTDKIIHINERIFESNNHIDERILTIYKEEDNYVVCNMKHDESRSTYFVKSHEKQDPDYEFFQLGKDNAINLIKEVLKNLGEIPNISTILDLDLICERIKEYPKEKEQPKVKMKK